MAIHPENTVSWEENLEEEMYDWTRDIKEIIEFYRLDSDDKRKLNIKIHKWIDELV